MRSTTSDGLLDMHINKEMQKSQPDKEKKKIDLKELHRAETI